MAQVCKKCENIAMKTRLKNLRNARKLTLDQLADATGLSKGFLSQLETGARQPSSETLKILAEYFNISERDLMFPSSGFAEPQPSHMRDSLIRMLDSEAGTVSVKIPAPPENDLRIGTDGSFVQIIATVDRKGIDRLIKRLEIMKTLLDD